MPGTVIMGVIFVDIKGFPFGKYNAIGTNLGSIRCPSVYHHLNNYGTNSIMIAIGTMHKAEKIAADGTRQVRDVVELGITLDERVADGFYFGRSLKIVQHLMSHPELLDRPLKEAIDLDC